MELGLSSSANTPSKGGGVLDLGLLRMSKTPPLEGVLAELESPSSKTPLGPAGGTSDLFFALKTVSEQHQSMFHLDKQESTGAHGSLCSKELRGMERV